MIRIPLVGVLTLALAACAQTSARPDSARLMSSTSGVATIAESDPKDDPYLWLEEVESPRALAQVESWNADTAAKLTSSPAFANYQQRAEDILSSDERIAAPSDVMGDWVTNFWRDATNTHGLWRRAKLDDYLVGTHEWDVLLDLDALSEAEGRNWVLNSIDCREPDYDRCLILLSDGGSDAAEIREFDMATKSFVEGGFTLGAAKHDVGWFDEDHLLIASDFGPSTLNESGYGREARLWRRGTDVMDAPVIYTAPKTDAFFGISNVGDGDTRYPLLTRYLTFWDKAYKFVRPDGSLVDVDIPATADMAGLFDGKAIILLNEDWQGRQAGSLVAFPLDPLMTDGTISLTDVFTPSASQAVQSIRTTGDHVYISLLDDVSGRLIALDKSFRQSDVPVPANAVVSLDAAAGERDLAFFEVESFARPPRLMATTAGAAPTEVDALKPNFDPDSIEIAQRFATSKDGTRIPYFVVRPKGAGGALPTVLHLYGGFSASQLPVYLSEHPFRLGPMAQFWLEEGKSFVLANVRGGDEYGPDWHRQTLKENRQKVNDDLYAIAEDLKASNLSSSIAASGRSNGGLVVGVAYTQRPDLFDGIVMGVPLADMFRYDKLLAGASWTGEYGDPDVPEEWEVIRQYSPYQNLSPDAEYPPVLFYTSTKDDRVHPAHARKMAAKMAAAGQPFYYYENTEGGHAGAANAEEEAYRAALVMMYAKTVLD
ncbi:MAG: prolyl oligopeptidase family serine peptidase [Pacificimonas sp.]